MLTSALRAWRRAAYCPRGGTASGVFVGRARELGRLERALDATRAGSGTTALVAGDAGIGKSRLVSELAARARAAGFEVLVGRCIDLVGTQLPYQPFVEALRPLGAPATVDERTAGSQLRVFEQTLALLTDRAASAPVLLVLEDLHWADTSTLDLVVYPRAQPRRPARRWCSRPTARTSRRRRSGCAGSPTPSGVRARR